MITAVVVMFAVLTPFDPSSLHADASAELLFPDATARQVASEFPLVTATERRVTFEGTRTILGVACTGSAFVLEFSDDAPNPAPVWGCVVRRPALPEGTIARFSLATGKLERLVLPPGRIIPWGDLPCQGTVRFGQDFLSGCALASPRRTRDVDLPAGAELSVGLDGGLQSVKVPGDVVTAAGRTWGREYTPCGGLYLWFDKNGKKVPPEPDPNHETCCD